MRNNGFQLHPTNRLWIMLTSRYNNATFLSFVHMSHILRQCYSSLLKLLFKRHKNYGIKLTVLIY